MPNSPGRLSTVPRAYLDGVRSTVIGQTSHKAYLLQQVQCPPTTQSSARYLFP